MVGYSWKILSKIVKGGLLELMHLYAINDKNNTAICRSKGRILWVQQTERAKQYVGNH